MDRTEELNDEVAMIVELTEEEFKGLSGAAGFFLGYFEKKDNPEALEEAKKVVQIVCAVKDRGFKVRGDN